MRKRLSLRNRIFRRWIKASKLKDFFRLPEDTIIEKAKQLNSENPFQIPQDSDFIYSDRIVEDSFHCLCLENPRTESKAAILYLHGGGMILAPTKKDLRLIKDLSRKTGKDVWAPHYPLCIEHSIDQTFSVVYEYYRQMVDQYGAENISVIGFSAGASLAIGMGLHNNVQTNKLAMPAKIIACAPGSVSPSLEIKERMEELNSQDFILDMDFMNNIEQILTKGKDLPGYMLGIEGDYSNFPTTYLYYGGAEILYSLAPYIMDSFKKYNSNCILDVAPEMFHCYMMFHFFPEAKQTWKEIVELLK